MKRLFTILWAMTLFVAANAQKVMQENQYVAPFADQSAIVNAPASKASITPTAGQIWWANYDTNSDASWWIDGTSKAEHYNVATFIPADVMPGAGRTIDGFSFFPISSNMKNVKVWISKTLPAYGSNADLETVSVSSVTVQQFNDVAFTSKHEVPAGGLYVGFSFDISLASGNYDKKPIVYTDVTSRENGLLYNTASAKTWKKSSNLLLAKVLFGGGNYATNAAVIQSSSFGSAFVKKGETQNIPVNIQNLGTSAVTSLTFSIATEGAGTVENTVNVNISGFQSIASVNVPLKSDSEAKKYNKVITLTKVNGVANEVSSSTSGSLITLTTVPERMPVVEEFTGTWCGYCPYGFVGMEKAKEKYGDKVALIAVHNGNGGSEVMEISDYTPVVQTYANGFPSAVFNREYVEHAYYIVDVLNQIINDPTGVSIEGTAMWSGTDKKAVNFATQTKFFYADNNGNYAISFVLVEDGLTGSGSSWAQSNYLSGESVDADMSWWASQSSKVSGLSYDHVAVAAWEPLKGIDGSVNTTINADEVQNFSYTASLTSQSLNLIQDKSKLQAFALLIDRTNGRIVNATRMNIQDYAAGIMDIENAAATVTSYYTIDGKLLQAPRKGVNIVRYSDGSTRKIVMK